MECGEWRVECRKERGVPRSSCLMTLREGERVFIPYPNRSACVPVRDAVRIKFPWSIE